MRALKPLALLPILALLAGCFGSAPAVPKQQYFRLVAAAPAAQSGKQISGGLEIVPFAGEGVMTERPLLFTADGGRKLEQRNYAYWTDAPPQMLRDQLVTYLRQAGVADNVAPSELRLEAAYIGAGDDQASGAACRLKDRRGDLARDRGDRKSRRPAYPQQGLHRGDSRPPARTSTTRWRR